ncbi:MAG: DinB family protein [Pirellulaceae bacterium]|nr:DinB family protein [Pirellulaceae bacterium]
MFESEANLNRFLRQYLKLVTSDLSEEQLDQAPISGFHSVRWILCHLAIAGDMGLLMAGRNKHSPSGWRKAYGPGSDGQIHPQFRPTKQEALSLLTEIYEDLSGAVQMCSPDMLNQAHQLELLKQSVLQTNQHLLAHLLTTHFAVHLGQISTLRRQLGLPHLF